MSFSCDVQLATHPKTQPVYPFGFLLPCSWLPNKQVPVSRIRLPDHSERPLPLAWDGCEDVEVGISLLNCLLSGLRNLWKLALFLLPVTQVLSRAKDTEACGWWPAIILEWSRGSEVGTGCCCLEIDV